MISVEKHLDLLDVGGEEHLCYFTEDTAIAEQGFSSTENMKELE